MGIEQEAHRPGALKQQNKPHKHGRHRSKGSISISNKGKVGVRSLTSKRSRLDVSKAVRRHQLVQHRATKREEVLMKKRKIGTGEKAAPFLVCLIPLGFDAKPEKVLEMVFACDSEAKITCSKENIFHVAVPRWKQRFSFITPEKGNLYQTLDALKVSDTVIFLASALTEELLDEPSEILLACILSQGLPSTIIGVLDLEKISTKKRQGVKQEIQKQLQHKLPEAKLMGLEKNGDAVNLLRKIGSQKQRSIKQRDLRPHLLAEAVDFLPESETSAQGTLLVTGYLRGQNLSANSLVHIPGWGDFQLGQIDSVDDEHALNRRPERKPTIVLQVADPVKRVSLISENTPDPMDAEQTWPTKEELEEAEERKRKVKRVPKGMSDYQAAWIPDEDGFEVGSEDEEGDEGDEDMQVESDNESVPFEDCLTETVAGDLEVDQYDEKMIDKEEEKIALKAKRDAAREEAAFPDEVDTPQDIPARERFQKYRGLASFRTSPWDPKENLPADYARIFQFENFDRTRRRVLSEIEQQLVGAIPGNYIRIHVINVPRSKYEMRQRNQPLVIFGMLPYEHQMSLINVVVKRSVTAGFHQEPVKSKDPVIVHCGYRRFLAQPTYSQHTNGSKHKYERFFQPDSTVVASMYAPITFPPASVILFTPKENSKVSLLATGRMLSVNPNRMNIKRVILSGHPFRVLKRTAIVRFMFFNREDIEWFKPVELRTKYGRRGHIKEPLGTHGHMKCVFEDQLRSQDTVLLYLYKRVYPKWSYETNVGMPKSLYAGEETEGDHPTQMDQA